MAPSPVGRLVYNGHAEVTGFQVTIGAGDRTDGGSRCGAGNVKTLRTLLANYVLSDNDTPGGKRNMLKRKKEI